MLRMLLGGCLFLASISHAKRCAESLTEIADSLNDSLRFGFAADGTSISVWSKRHPDSFVAALFYRYDPVTRVIWKTASESATIHDMEGKIIAEYKGKGLSDQLHAELLKKYPDARLMGSELTKLNREKYFEGISRGLRPEDAVRETPSYKSAAKQGFSRILLNPVSGLLSHLPDEKVDRGQKVILILARESP